MPISGSRRIEAICRTVDETHHWLRRSAVNLDSLRGLLLRIVGRFPALEKWRLSHRSFSQEGEDRLLARFFEGSAPGFYIDVGAHHPFIFSNTQIFYDSGWRGINIDALPGSMHSFARYRPRDVNLEIAIGQTRSVSKFYVFNVPALNTFDEELARSRDHAPFRIERVIEIPLLPLADVLGEHLPAGTDIDFLSVDVEGWDLEVLKSNDWTRFRPKVVLAELFGSTIGEASSDPLFFYLASVGYEPLAKTINTWLFVDRSKPGSEFTFDRITAHEGADDRA